MHLCFIASYFHTIFYAASSVLNTILLVLIIDVAQPSPPPSHSYVDYGNCGAASTSQDRVSSSCCAEVRTLPLLWAIDLDAWVDQLVAMSALLLCLRFFK